jgi:hypothetical protein
MAELMRDGQDLVVKLNVMEKAEAMHGEVRVPWAAVQSMTVLEDAIHAVHGLKLPGSRLPGVFAMGTFKSNEGNVFAIVHHQTPRGVKVTLTGAAYDALIIGTEDPEAVVAALTQRQKG